MKLNIYRVPGLKNELCDWLSCENFDERISASSESLSRKAFQKMDVHLDLNMSKAELLSALQRSDYLEEYGSPHPRPTDRSRPSQNDARIHQQRPHPPTTPR